MHRFYIKEDSIIGDTVLWNEKESHHILKVLRLSEGDKVIGFDGTGLEYDILLNGINHNNATGTIIAIRKADREIPIFIELVQGIAKADKMDWIIQKMTELGVCCIVPIITKNTVVKLDEKKKEQKQKRWGQIAVEASKQCRRNKIAEIKPVQDYIDFIKEDFQGITVLFYEIPEETSSLKKILKENIDKILTNGIRILIGPEGGWNPLEIDMAMKKNYFIAGLGPRILRTETAGIVAISAILYEIGAME